MQTATGIDGERWTRKLLNPYSLADDFKCITNRVVGLRARRSVAIKIEEKSVDLPERIEATSISGKTVHGNIERAIARRADERKVRVLVH